MAWVPAVTVSAKPSEKKDLADLLIREVLYDEPNETITATLYPLPELPEVALAARFRKASKLARTARS